MRISKPLAVLAIFVIVGLVASLFAWADCRRAYLLLGWGTAVVAGTALVATILGRDSLIAKGLGFGGLIGAMFFGTAMAVECLVLPVPPSLVESYGEALPILVGFPAAIGGFLGGTLAGACYGVVSNLLGKWVTRPGRATEALACVLLLPLAWSIGVAGIFAFLKSTATSPADPIRNSLMALRGYSERHRRLPPAVNRDNAGRPLSSWRFALTSSWLRDKPAILYYDLRFAWDAPENAQLREGVRGIYCLDQITLRSVCERLLRWNEHPSYATNVFAITGPGTAFDEENVIALWEIPDDTILLMEVQNSGVHWMQPGDFDIRDMAASIPEQGFGGHRKGFHVGFADGQVWLIGNDVPFELLRKFFTIDGAQRLDRDTVLGPYGRNVFLESASPRRPRSR